MKFCITFRLTKHDSIQNYHMNPDSVILKLSGMDKDVYTSTEKEKKKKNNK